ncbi:MAG: regulatory protein RecX [Nitrospirae bacterium]|nr:regulatory protein RecX [Nitrospirota bacterium]
MARPGPGPEKTAEAARETAYRLLKRREHSRAELATKLLLRGYEEDVVTRVVRELTARRELSDERFAEFRAKARLARGYGPSAVVADLRARGIGREAAEVCVSRSMEDVPEREAARKALARTGWGRGERTPEARRRAHAHLDRRGFSPGLIRQILKPGPEEENE